MNIEAAANSSHGDEILEPKLLGNILIVMVGTTHPGNIGAAARAMGVMGISRLSLARPETDHLSPDSVARSAGYGSILENASVHTSLRGALSKVACAYAFTARQRDMDPMMLDPRGCAALAARQMAEGSHVALVFGPEHSGLANLETDLCNSLVRIPTGPKRGSLNLAAAVQIACYETLYELRQADPEPRAESSSLATKAEITHLLDHLARVLNERYPVGQQGLYDKMMRRLTRLVNHAHPQSADVRMLRGMLSHFESSSDD